MGIWGYIQGDIQISGTVIAGNTIGITLWSENLGEWRVLLMRPVNGFHYPFAVKSDKPPASVISRFLALDVLEQVDSDFAEELGED